MNQEEPTKKEPSNISHTVIVIGLILAGVGLIYRAISLKMDRQQPIAQESCETSTRSYTMQDSYLRGLIKKGQSFDVLMSYYDCHEPKPGDLVLYRFSSKSEPVVKIVRAIPGDEFELTENSQLRRWEIKVNGEDLIYRQNKYYFGRVNDRHPMKKYHDLYSGEIQSGDFIIFSLIPPGLQDSGTLGPVRKENILGKVLPPEQRQAQNIEL